MQLDVWQINFLIIVGQMYTTFRFHQKKDPTNGIFQEKKVNIKFNPRSVIYVMTNENR